MPTNRQLPSTPLLNALEAFADALEAAGVDPRLVEVSLPLSEWRHIAQTLEAGRGGATAGRHRPHRGRWRAVSHPLRGKGAVIEPVFVILAYYLVPAVHW